MTSTHREVIVTRLRLILAGVLAALLSACSPAPAATPTATPTFSCTPEAGGSPSPCNQQQYEDMQRKDALYAEAESVFRRLVAEDERTYRIGGSDTLSEEYQALLGTKDLRDQQLDVVRAVKSDGSTITGGHFVLDWVKRQPGVSEGGSVVSVYGCVDMTAAKFLQHGRGGRPGPHMLQYLYLRPYDGVLKLTDFEFQVVKSC